MYDPSGPARVRHRDYPAYIEQNDPATGVDEETLRKRALVMLSEVEPLTFDEMHTLLVSGLETALDDALVSLQSDGDVIRARDGYRLTDDSEVNT